MEVYCKGIAISYGMHKPKLRIDHLCIRRLFGASSNNFKAKPHASLARYFIFILEEL